MEKINLEQTGKRIASLRKERGYTGEGLAERLSVSPQAVSKWERGKCLPETAILPMLAEALECSIDSLLYPRELFILEAIYTDGRTHIPVTRFVNDLVRDNTLNIYVNPLFVGASLESDRLKILTVKFQTFDGTYFVYALQNQNLILDKKSGALNGCLAGEPSFLLAGAYYGNEKEFSPVMQKMEHYEFFKWNRILVNHENFPSSTASEDTEYLTLIYLNADGIHVISCPENEAVYYGNHRTELFLKDHSKCILKNIMRLSWEEGMECPWAGAMYAALNYMGESYTYDQLMGMSGACYRICFTDVWDYSSTDALVAYDYVTPLCKAVGYAYHIADRVEKKDRKAERLAIMEDIQKGKPVLAINLRVAPEWGVITGYTDQGSRFLCRTYFDKEIFDILEQEDCSDIENKKCVFEDNEGYLFSDFWPFLIMHLDEKVDPPSSLETLKASLDILVRSFYAEEARGYHQGKGAYRAWMEGLAREADFCLESDADHALRRLGVNDNMLCTLIDARRAAASYLRENISLLPEKNQKYLAKIAENCQIIADACSSFRDRVLRASTCAIAYNTVHAFGASTPELRREQINVLEYALALEKENCSLAEYLLEA